MNIGGFADFIINCYGMTVPENADSIAVEFKNSIFPNGSRPTLHGFQVFLHYPNQFLRSIGTKIYAWEAKSKDDYYTMAFSLTNMEVVKRRSKSTDQCSQRWRNYDEQILVDHVKKVGCRAPYQTPSQQFPKCNTQEKMNESVFRLSANGYDVVPPCKIVGKTFTSYLETQTSNTSEWFNPGHFWAVLRMQGSHFKEIENNR